MMLYRCSFCHKSQDVVGGNSFSSPERLPRAYICDECICGLQLDYWRTTRSRLPRGSEIRYPSRVEVKEFLDQYVIGQDSTKKKLAVAVLQPLQARPHEPPAQHRGGAAKIQYPADRPPRGPARR